jgi:hypothetical protein
LAAVEAASYLGCSSHGANSVIVGGLGICQAGNSSVVVCLGWLLKDLTRATAALSSAGLAWVLGSRTVARAVTALLLAVQLDYLDCCSQAGNSSVVDVSRYLPTREPTALLSVGKAFFRYYQTNFALKSSARSETVEFRRSTSGSLATTALQDQLLLNIRWDHVFVSSHNHHDTPNLLQLTYHTFTRPETSETSHILCCTYCTKAETTIAPSCSLRDPFHTIH